MSRWWNIKILLNNLNVVFESCEAQIVLIFISLDNLWLTVLHMILNANRNFSAHIYFRYCDHWTDPIPHNNLFSFVKFGEVNRNRIEWKNVFRSYKFKWKFSALDSIFEILFGSMFDVLSSIRWYIIYRTILYVYVKCQNHSSSSAKIYPNHIWV